jgi:hypothetical protein
LLATLFALVASAIASLSYEYRSHLEPSTETLAKQQVLIRPNVIASIPISLEDLGPRESRTLTFDFKRMANGNVCNVVGDYQSSSTQIALLIRILRPNQFEERTYRPNILDWEYLGGSPIGNTKVKSQRMVVRRTTSIGQPEMADLVQVTTMRYDFDIANDHSRRSRVHFERALKPVTSVDNGGILISKTPIQPNDQRCPRIMVGTTRSSKPCVATAVQAKLVEILRFGTVGKPTVTAELAGTSFLAPSCQIRVVANGGETEGMLLGSTKNWTYKSDGETDGILLFQPAETAPRAWKLELREEEYPILYVDNRIPDAAHWARTDAVFSACVLPHVIGAVFQHIFETGSKPEDGWMAEWIAWAATLVPANPPPFGTENKEQRTWVEALNGLRPRICNRASCHISWV